MVGIDSNGGTAGGQGSVTFSVTVNGTVLAQTGVKREGMAPEPVAVDLNGVTEFTLKVGDAGDGISCDQSNWADAKVTLADGRELWLGDIPLRDLRDTHTNITALDRRTNEVPISFRYDGVSSDQLSRVMPLSR
jgi:hypothetical protein